MPKWCDCLVVTIAVFWLPFLITWLLKSTGEALGPVVLGYSLFAGAGSAFFWFYTAWQRLNRVVAVLVFIPLGLLKIILLLNAFIAITALMGAMNYQLM
jgi:hypothetical protein